MLKLLTKMEGLKAQNTFNSSFYKFLIVHTSFLIFTGLPGIFINTFLMAQTGNMEVVLYYNILSFLSVGFGMLISAFFLHRFSAGIVSLIGIIGYNLLYLQLILLQGKSADYVVLLGLTNGFSGSFYWLGYSHLVTECSNLKNRDKAIAILSISGSAVNLVVPLISGAAISAIGGTFGYTVIFILAFAMSIVTAIGAMRLSKLKTKPTRAEYRAAVKIIFDNRCIRNSICSEWFKGIREGAFAFILSILLYHLVKVEALVGLSTFLSSAASIACFVIIEKMVNKNNRIQFMKRAFFVLVGFSIVLIFAVNPIVIILFAIVNSFFAGFILNPSFSTFIDTVQVTPNALEKSPEIFAIKESFVAIGRCMGIVFILIMNHLTKDNLIWQAISLFIITLTQFGTIIMSGKAIKNMK